MRPADREVIRASKTTAVRYERDRPGELVHMDVKKIGRIPDGGGWRAHGRQMGDSRAKKARIGYDYVHSLVDDHTRLAYSEILPDEKGQRAPRSWPGPPPTSPPTASRIERVMTDNHWSYTRSHDVRAAIAALGAEHMFIRPHCPWQNGKVERFNRTLQIEWAYRQVFTTNAERCAALAPWLEHYNTDDATPPSEATHRSADCHQPDGRRVNSGSSLIPVAALAMSWLPDPTLGTPPRIPSASRLVRVPRSLPVERRSSCVTVTSRATSQASGRSRPTA